MTLWLTIFNQGTRYVTPEFKPFSYKRVICTYYKMLVHRMQNNLDYFFVTENTRISHAVLTSFYTIFVLTTMGL